MPVIPALFAALAGAAVVLGFWLFVLPRLDPRVTAWRALLLGITTLLAWRYLIWRFAETLAPLDWTPSALASWGFALLEALTIISSTFAFIILSRTRERSAEADQNAAWWAPRPPRVDLFIATYNEEREVLERTIIGAKAMRFPGVRIFVLDDGLRSWLAELCREHEVGYITRPDNAHAKAGNLNHALFLRLNDEDAPEFIAVLDADFVPHRDFVERALALFHDPAVALVQTPQHFFNPDPIQHNLRISAGYPDEQRHFFDNVQPARDAWGTAICCGTSSMARCAALEAIGGVPVESVTEDFLLTLRLSELGWKTVYLNEPLTEGLAPEGLREYIVQRGRWCLGLMQIVRRAYNPFRAHGLSLRQRFSVLDALLYWTSTFPFRLACLICPLLYWWLGITVVNASLADVIAYFLPYYVAVIAVLNWLSRGIFLPVLTDVGQLVAAWPITKAVALGLITPGPHEFSVTAKGGDRTRVVIQWQLMRPFAVLLILTLGGLLLPLWSDFGPSRTGTAEDGIGVVLFWTLYNVVVLIVTMAACIERPRWRRPLRQEDELTVFRSEGRRQSGWIVNLGAGGARIIGPVGLEAGTVGTLAVPGIGDIEAQVVAVTEDGYRLRFAPTPVQASALIERLHTRAGAPGTVSGSVSGLVKTLARALHR